MNDEFRRCSDARGRDEKNGITKFQYHLTKMELLDGLGHLPFRIVEDRGTKVLVELRVVIYPMTIYRTWKSAFHRVFMFLNTRPRIVLAGNPKLANTLIKAVRHLCSNPPVPRALDSFGPTQDELLAMEIGQSLSELMREDRLRARELAGKILVDIREASVGRPPSSGIEGRVSPGPGVDYEFRSATLVFGDKRRRFYAGKALPKAFFELLLEHQEAGLARINAVDFISDSKDAYALTGDPEERLIGALREINDTNSSKGIPLRVKLDKGAYRLNRTVRIIRSK